MISKTIVQEKFREIQESICFELNAESSQKFKEDEWNYIKETFEKSLAGPTPLAATFVDKVPICNHSIKVCCADRNPHSASTDFPEVLNILLPG